MKEFNFSKDSEYHTQRNNMLIPFSSCNQTAAIMALKQAGHKLETFPEAVQPEDYLTELLQSKQSYEIMSRIAAWAIDKRPPNEIHIMLEWAVNKLLGEYTEYFTSRATKAKVIKTLQIGGGVTLSGWFETEKRKIGHIVSLCGFYVNSEMEMHEVNEDNITGWIIDDPYGDPHTKYKDRHGNNIKLTMKQFDTAFDKGEGFFWAHIFKAIKDE